MEDTAVRVSVIIVNLNGEHFISDCLEGLERQSFRDFEVLVVDNGSTDGSLAKLRSRFSSARLIELGRNQGFASACMRGFEQSRGAEIAVLNNDAVPEPAWLKEMVAFLDADPAIGAVACKVINRKSSKLESGGIFAARNGLVYLSRPAEENKPSEVFGACGVAALYRGSMLKEFGFYPEDFFIYYEDADLAYRLRRAGWKAVYCPGAIVHHLGSQTTSGMGIKNYFLPRNRLRTLVRNWEAKIILKNLPWIAFYELASFLAGIFTEPKSALKARIDFLRCLPRDLKARSQILARTAPDFELGKWLSPTFPGLRELWEARK